ncbi:hypothetical protein [Bradyrhizobium sp.]|uniref:hypothetical protein n=1 Tax=Bradyrhizobium sp. TaxID=376 RepID=UPI00261D64D7|nr:hypothetical protein [Bradyrhizobium sp.]
MGQAWKTDIQIVEVRTDDYVRGVARKEYWAAAAAPEQAMMLVLAAVPDESPARNLPAGFKLEPGETRWVG